MKTPWTGERKNILDVNIFAITFYLFSEMGGKVMVSESTVHDSGMTITGTVEGGVFFREEFRKV